MVKYEIVVTCSYGDYVRVPFKHYWDNANDALKDFYDECSAYNKLMHSINNDMDYVRVELFVKFEHEDTVSINTIAYCIDEEEAWLV